MVHEDLYPYQNYGAKWLAGVEAGLLADACGVGKSATSIGACDLVRAQKVLVLCPGVARVNWEREFNKFSIYKRHIGIVESTAKGVPSTDVVIASYSIIGSRPILTKLLAREWDVLICDEAHYLKNREAIRTKCVYGAKTDRSKGIASKAKRVYLLTGTPIPNSLAEMFTHCKALFPEACQGVETYRKWTDHFCVMDEMGSKVLASKNVKDFIVRIKPYTLRRTLEDVLPDLPALRFSQVIVSPDKLPEKSSAEVESEAIVRNAIAQKVLKAGGTPDNLTPEDLRAIEQIAGMHLATNRKWSGIAKAHAAAQIIKQDFESGMDKVVVFALHKEVFNILLKELPQARAIRGETPMDVRQQHIDAFQNGKEVNILIVQLSIGATALTLTASCNVLFAEYGWSPADLLQAAKRCHRFGQTRPVLARLISLAGSIDESVGSVLTRKSQSISKIETGITSKDGI